MAAKMPSKIEWNFGCDFDGQTELPNTTFGVGPAECAGALGRIMEGYESKFRQRIPAGIEGRGQEL